MITDLRPAYKLIVLLLYLFAIGSLSVLGTESVQDVTAFGKGALYISQFIGAFAIFILLPGLFILLTSKEKLNYTRINKFPGAMMMIIAAMVFILGMPFIAWLEQLNKQMVLPSSWSGLEQWIKDSEQKAEEISKYMLSSTSVKGLVVNLFVIAFMAALSEEFFFRGILQRTIAASSGKLHLAVWTSAVLFSAFHLQFYGFFPRMIMGAVLGYLFAWSGSLWTNVLAHFVNNGVAVVLTWLANRGTIDADMQNGPKEVSAVAGLVSMALVFALMYFVYRNKRIEKEVPLDEMGLPLDQV